MILKEQTENKPKIYMRQNKFSKFKSLKKLMKEKEEEERETK